MMPPESNHTPAPVAVAPAPKLELDLPEDWAGPEEHDDHGLCYNRRDGVLVVWSGHYEHWEVLWSNGNRSKPDADPLICMAYADEKRAPVDVGLHWRQATPQDLVWWEEATGEPVEGDIAGIFVRNDGWIALGTQAFHSSGKRALDGSLEGAMARVDRDFPFGDDMWAKIIKPLPPPTMRQGWSWREGSRTITTSITSITETDTGVEYTMGHTGVRTWSTWPPVARAVLKTGPGSPWSPEDAAEE